MGSGGSQRQTGAEREHSESSQRSADGTEMSDTIRILHVDDDRDLVELTADYLKRQDRRLDVVTETAVNDALNRIEAEQIECVVSDYDMSPTDGMEFLRTVRRDHKDLPFVLLTGKGSEEIASKAISEGVTDYLQKGHGIDHYTVLANRITNAVEQYRSQRRLETSQKRLSLFFDRSPLGVIEWNSDFEIVRLNDAATDILGYTEAELAGESWETIVPESDRDSVETTVTDLLEGTGGYRHVNENIRKDGVRIVCEWHNRFVTDEDGVVAVFSQFQDITDRKQREQAITNLHDVATELAECETRPEVFEKAVTAADSLPMFDHSGIAVEDGGELQITASSDESRVEEAPIAFHRDIADRGTVLIDDIEQAETLSIETISGSMIGVPIGEHGVFQVYNDQPGTFDEQDVEMAELLAQHTENELDRLAYERELEQKKQQLEEQNEQLDEFVSVVSHDLRNPIQVVSTTVELAAETGDDEYFERCQRATARMEQLLDDLLALAREQSRELEREPIEVAELVSRCWNTVETADAELDIDTDQVVEADRGRLKQLVENLVGNAIEHAGTDVTVTIGELPREDGFYIADDGPGIPEADREDIFEYGYSNQPNGTGFGLTIVQQVVEDHGWDVRVTESERGGARFEILTADG